MSNKKNEIVSTEFVAYLLMFILFISAAFIIYFWLGWLASIIVIIGGICYIFFWKHFIIGKDNND
jgi:hypothetical protein